MINKRVVKKALKRSWESDTSDDRSCETSTLIFDIFGGEILKTRNKRGWHFYNRINGERIDFTGSDRGKSSGVVHFEDIPSTSDETVGYYSGEDYSTFLMRFIRVFEETVGLEKYQPVTS